MRGEVGTLPLFISKPQTIFYCFLSIFPFPQNPEKASFLVVFFFGGGPFSKSPKAFELIISEYNIRYARGQGPAVVSLHFFTEGKIFIQFYTLLFSFQDSFFFERSHPFPSPTKKRPGEDPRLPGWLLVRGVRPHWVAAQVRLPRCIAWGTVNLSSQTVAVRGGGGGLKMHTSQSV